MTVSRREILAGATAALGATQIKAGAAETRRALPKDFLWGTAISAYQSEGNNTNTDAWLQENIKPSLYKDRSGDSCDSYHRYAEDIAIAAKLGFNCYRMGIEWARIEPNEGHYSNAELDHYAKVLETCRAHGLKPVVSLNHFTVPLWFAKRGGFTVADSPDIFAAFCGKAAEHLGGLMHMATPFNEANIQLLVQIMPGLAKYQPAVKAALAAAAQATNSPNFSTMAYADPAISTPLMQDAHRKAYTAVKAVRPELLVGISLTTQDIQPVGPNSLADEYLKRLYGDWVDVARSHADFVGVQPYTRFLVDDKGITAQPKDAVCARPWTTAFRCTATCTGRCSTISNGRPAIPSILDWWAWIFRPSSARRSRARCIWVRSRARTGYEPECPRAPARGHKASSFSL